MLNFRMITGFIPQMLAGLGVNLLVTVLSFSMGTVLGLIAYRCKVSYRRLLRAIAKSYIEVIRNTPLLVQLYLIYFGLAQLGLDCTPFETSLIAISLNCGAYIAEIFRSGFKAIHPGQVEAGLAMGMSRAKVFLIIELPQALKSCSPALINQLIMTFLGSSIAYAISLVDLTYHTLNINSHTARSVEIFSIAGIMFYLTAQLVLRLLRKGEKAWLGWGK